MSTPYDTLYIVRGFAAEDDPDEGVTAGDPQWQFSDGPPGDRSVSFDYPTLEGGLRAHSGSRFVWVD